jgi:glucosylceramidase
MIVLHKFCILAATGVLVAGSLHAEPQGQASAWLTTQDRSSLVASQPGVLQFQHGSAGGATPFIAVDDKQTMQAIDGFGFALTGGSAQLLMKMSAPSRHELLENLFGANGDAINVSYLRVSIGSSDMNDHVFTYDDLPGGQKDIQLKRFSLGPDLEDVVPVLKEILAIHPDIKILGTPWSAPSWMKTNGLPKGGGLKPEYYRVYAAYLVKYIQAMKKQGIRIEAITPQNEPLNPKNTPSMVVTAEEEAAFIRQALGPAFRSKHIAAKIVIYDHNCDRPDYALAILSDREAAQYVDGSGFHLYGGTIDAMTKVHDAYPSKKLYFTEQMVVDHPKQGSELRIAEPVASIVIGATANWSSNVLLWNLAADPQFGPHTSDGGCPVCEGAITLDGDKATRNLAYYTIAHASKFIPPQSVRIASSASGATPHQVAFRRPDGKIVLLLANTTEASENFEIRFHGESMKASLPADAVATYVW